ncbi:MAG: hypothetical protein ABFD84_01240 [Candidatus Polarisedimenticolia bacterium]|nr:hypothetical protein [bacterium]
MSVPRFHVELRTPDGAVWDVSDRIDGSAVSSLTEETDETLLTLTHSDVTLTLANRDGFFTRMFAGAKPGDAYDVTIDRFAGLGRWSRVFGGTLDFPWSVDFDDYDRTCSIQAFAYTKLLEGATADGLKRTFSGVTGTVAASSSRLALTATTGLMPGDKLTLANGTTTETQVVARVVDSTHVVTVAAFTNAFTGAPVTLETPYYRGLTTAQLASSLAALAGITSVSVSIPAAFAAIPFPTVMDSQGLPSGAPDAILEKSSSLYVYQGGHRYYAADAMSAFVDGGADAVKQDWRPYLAAEPTTLLAPSGDGVVDYVDAAHPTYNVQADTQGNYSIKINLYKNGAFVATLGTIPPGADNAPTLDSLSFDLAPQWGEVWASWAGSYLGTNGARKDVLRVVRATTAGAILWVDTSHGGPVGSCDGGSRMAVAALPAGGGVSVYAAGGSLALTLAGVVSELSMHTFRRVGAFYCCVGYLWRGKSAVSVWDAETGALAATYEVSASAPTFATATCFTDNGGIVAEYDGYAGGAWFSVSTRSSGVIPYADFSGMSVLDALKELAIVNAAVIEVTPYRELKITSRSLVGADRDPIPLSSPLKRRRRPVWESYRAYAKVTGKDEGDADVAGEAGAIGDSAHELDVDVHIPITLGLAGALAQAYASWFGAVREQRDATHAEPSSGPVHLYDRVLVDDRVWRVTKAQIDLYSVQADLQMIAES